MTLGYWALVLPACEVAVIVLIVTRICWQRYPILLLYLGCEAFSNTITILASPWATMWIVSQPMRLVVRAAIVFEIMRFSCLTFTTRHRRVKVAWALGLVAWFWACTMAFVQVSPFQSLMIFRQYYHMALALVMSYVWVSLRLRPVCENQEHRAYRSLMTLNMIRIFLSSIFVKGGFGYLVFKYDESTWKVADSFMWIAMLMIVIALGYRMTSDFSSLKPELAEKRWKVVAGG